MTGLHVEKEFEQEALNKREQVQRMIQTVLGEGWLAYGNDPTIFRHDEDFCGTTRTMVTSGLNSIPTGFTYKEKTVYFELIGAVDKQCEQSGDWFLEIVYETLKCNLPLKPGFVIMNPEEVMKLNKDFKAVVMITPMFWEELNFIETDHSAIAWLMPVPILKNELKLMEKKGFDALLDYFEEKEVDVFDFSRKS